MLNKPRLFSQTEPLIITFFSLFVHYVFLEVHNLKLDIAIQLRCELVSPDKADLSAILYARREIPQSVQVEARFEDVQLCTNALSEIPNPC